MNVVFNNPSFLWFLLVVPLLIIVHFLTLKYGKKEALKFSNFEAIARVTKEKVSSKPYASFMSKNTMVLAVRASALTLLILAVAGTVVWYEGKTSEFDFVLAIDASSSMLADDFSPNRLEATKVAANLFVDSLAQKSRVGIVTFSGTSFVEQKITEERMTLKEKINGIKVSKIGGTDLANAIITSSNLLTNEEDKGKAIILLTDGQSNVGMSVEDGIDYANKENVIIHTIGVGTEEGGKFTGSEIVSKLDEDTLKKIASLTGGEYFRADSKEGLAEAYKSIAGLNIRKISFNLTPLFMMVALLSLVLEWILIHTRYRIVS